MNIAIIISSIISAVLLLIIIFYDGGLRNNDNSTTFRKQLTSLNGWGKTVVIIVLLLAITDPTLTIINNNKTNENYKRDTTRLTNFIDVLEEQKLEDRNRIDFLTKLSKVNIDKTDSINKNIIFSMVEESKRQLEAIKEKNQNIYLHFQDEILQNYVKLIHDYDSTHLRGFTNLTSFTSSRFTNEYTKQISHLCNDYNVVNNQKGISAVIDQINEYHKLSIGIKGDQKRSNIESILRYTKQMKYFLLIEYMATNKYDNFQDYKKYRPIKDYHINIDSVDNSIRSIYNLKH